MAIAMVVMFSFAVVRQARQLADDPRRRRRYTPGVRFGVENAIYFLTVAAIPPPKMKASAAMTICFACSGNGDP